MYNVIYKVQIHFCGVFESVKLVPDYQTSTALYLDRVTLNVVVTELDRSTSPNRGIVPYCRQNILKKMFHGRLTRKKTTKMIA